MPAAAATATVVLHDDCQGEQAAPTAAGGRTVDVRLGGAPLRGSPFRVIVRAGDAHGPSCVMRGEGPAARKWTLTRREV